MTNDNHSDNNNSCAKPASEIGADSYVSILHKPELTSYDEEFPYLPRQQYPELAFFSGAARQNRPVNNEGNVFKAVRDVLAMNCDVDNFGSANWNPLAKWISPGMRVCIKPNLVMHKNLGGDDLFSSIAHPSVVAVMAVYAALALKGQGEISICDSPQWNCNMSEQLKHTRLDKLCEEFTERLGVKFTFADLRMYEAVYDQGLEGLVKEIKDLPGDPRGYSEVDLAGASALESCESFDNLFGSDYDRRAIRERHARGRHVYVMANSVLGADCVINIPKFKTHKKAGLTCAMKNLVGAIGDKNCLPHFRIGYGCRGDESDAPVGGPLRRFVMGCKHKTFWMMNDLLMARHTKLGYHIAAALRTVDIKFNNLTKNKFVYRNGQTWGNWRGNRTIGPLTVDLNTILNYVDSRGVLQDRPVRNMVNLVDGIIAGEGDGPLSPTARPLGVVMFSDNAYANDSVVAALMGFDRSRIHTFSAAEQLADVSRPLAVNIDNINILSNDPVLTDCISPQAYGSYFAFDAHAGWKGNVEKFASAGGQAR